jgi:hypothetical protein
MVGFNYFNNLGYPRRDNDGRQWKGKKTYKNDSAAGTNMENQKNHQMGPGKFQKNSSSTFMKMQCFLCGQEGHLKRSCPAIVCFFCNKKGHVKKCCSYYSSYLQNLSFSTANSEFVNTLSNVRDTHQKREEIGRIFEVFDERKLEEIRVSLETKMKELEIRLDKLTIKLWKIDGLIDDRPVLVEMKKDIAMLINNTMNERLSPMGEAFNCLANDFNGYKNWMQETIDRLNSDVELLIDDTCKMQDDLGMILNCDPPTRFRGRGRTGRGR